MKPSAASAQVPPLRPRAAPVPASGGVRVVAGVAAVSCIGFAVVSLDLLTTGFFASSGYDKLTSEYPIGFAVANVLVLALKLAGAAVAVLSVVPPRHRFLGPAVLGVCLWSAFATLAVYCAGSVAEGVGMLAGGEGIAPREAAYVAFFALYAACYGVLAFSYHRRAGLRPRHAVLGLLGAAMLGCGMAATFMALAALDLVPA
ncbi:hypothetical protein ITI46_09100 [Streptomyces oryzae]|uniref:DUF5658 domain-containing protein n=1 Tax=Streptomyces oryzae TaxID=1434886 RepID=A0ABS3X8Z0_9ACTN|nr:hypothetical protein [Streptomyces oryzae]MBO8191833.1 hypothetical protein [Streptomyces oryzae]